MAMLASDALQYENTRNKIYPSEHWTQDISDLDLVLSYLSYRNMCYLGELRSPYGHALLVLTKWSKSTIQGVLEQKTI